MASFSTKRYSEKPSEWKLKQLHKRQNIEKLKRKTCINPSSSLSSEFLSNSETFHGVVVERQGDRVIIEVRNASMHHAGAQSDQLLFSNPPKHVTCSLSNRIQEDITLHLQDTQNNQKTRQLMDSTVVVGDVVTVALFSPDSMREPIIVSVQTRKNLISQPTAGSSHNKLELKALAANIDQILIVVAQTPKTPLISIDRFLVAAQQLSIPNAVIVVNKFDLPGSDELFLSIAHYQAIGYPVIKASTLSFEGLQELKNVFCGKTSILVGQSGVGKSSLIGSLIPDADVYVGELGGKKKDVGTHTTSNARLYRLLAGENHHGESIIVDSPGIRELGTWHLSRQSIVSGFVEIKQLSRNCKFRNCRHDNPLAGNDCAVLSAVRSGAVHKERLRSFLALMRF
jgi:ribosome biogenesis GTPase